MSEYKKYVSEINASLVSYQQQEDYFMESMKNSLAISNLYSELWERAMTVRDLEKREELMIIVKNAKRAKQVYDLMLNRYQYANTECARQIQYNKALMQYVEQVEMERDMLIEELNTQKNNNGYTKN